MHVLYNSDSKYGYDFYCESGLIKYIERRAPKGIKELPVIKTFEAYGKDYGVDRFYNVDDAIKFLKDDNKTDNTIYKLLCNIRYEWNVREVIGKLRRSADEYFNDHYEDTYSDQEAMLMAKFPMVWQFKSSEQKIDSETMKRNFFKETL